MIKHTDQWVASFETFAKSVLEQAEVPGVSLGLAVHGEIVYEGNFGSREGGRDVRPTIDTVFGLGSISKPFTALSIALLADAGRLRFDDPVNKYIPELCEFPRQKFNDGITIHHLLTHTSGLPNEWAIFYARAPSMRQDPDVARITTMRLPYDFFTTESAARDINTWEELVYSMAQGEYELLGPPGRFYSYSNEGYALLQGVVERVSGMSQRNFLAENVWTPLGMAHTDTQQQAVSLFPEVTELFARFKEGVGRSPAWQDIGQIIGNGGLASTVRDLLRLLQLFLNQGTVDGRKLLSPETLEEMTKPHASSYNGGSYGYGLQRFSDYHGVSVIGHGGGNKGVAGYFGYVPKQGISVAGLSNLTGAPTQRLCWALINALLGVALEEAPAGPPVFSLRADTLPDYAGTYGLGRRTMTFFEDNGIIWLEAQPAPIALRALAEDSFMDSGGRVILFTRNESSSVRGVYLDNRVLPKVETPESG